MKKIILTSAIIMAAGATHADVTPYVSLKSGYMANVIEVDTSSLGAPPGYKYIGIGDFDGFVGSVAGGIGGEIDPFVSLRGELEYSYARTSMIMMGEKMTLNANAFMVNGYVDLGEKSWAIKPYVGAGAGYGFGNASMMGESIDGDGGFIYSGTIGATYAFNQKFALDASVKRWINNGSIKMPLGPSLDTQYVGTSFMLGARYSF